MDPAFSGSHLWERSASSAPPPTSNDLPSSGTSYSELSECAIVGTVLGALLVGIAKKGDLLLPEGTKSKMQVVEASMRRLYAILACCHRIIAVASSAAAVAFIP